MSMITRIDPFRELASFFENFAETSGKDQLTAGTFVPPPRRVAIRWAGRSWRMPFTILSPSGWRPMVRPYVTPSRITPSLSSRSMP